MTLLKALFFRAGIISRVKTLDLWSGDDGAGALFPSRRRRFWSTWLQVLYWWWLCCCCKDWNSVAGLFFSFFLFYFFGCVHPSGLLGLALLQRLDVIDTFAILIYILYLKKRRSWRHGRKFDNQTTSNTNWRRDNLKVKAGYEGELRKVGTAKDHRTGLSIACHRQRLDLCRRSSDYTTTDQHGCPHRHAEETIMTTLPRFHPRPFSLTFPHDPPPTTMWTTGLSGQIQLQEFALKRGPSSDPRILDFVFPPSNCAGEDVLSDSLVRDIVSWHIVTKHPCVATD